MQANPPTHAWSSAKALKLEVEEWPLPQTDTQVKTVIFEICCPLNLGRWRDTAVWMLQTLSSKHPESSESFAQVHDYLHRRVRWSGRKALDISLCSSTKSFHDAHYSIVSIPAYETDIIKNHPMHWHLSTTSGIQLSPDIYQPDVHQFCVSNLHEKAYKPLQFAVDSTTHFPMRVSNAVHSRWQSTGTKNFTLQPSVIACSPRWTELYMTSRTIGSKSLASGA